ncbi:MAG: GGDEF domain-containing protein [Gammaproteobacteria bacterium]|nr:GGDEF domain-containing protein [Gammaproteobacteria bacterium]
MATRKMLQGELTDTSPDNKYLLIRYFLSISKLSASIAAIIHIQQGYHYLAGAELILSALTLYFLFLSKKAYSFDILIPFVTILIYLLFITGAISQQNSFVNLVCVPLYPFIYFYLTNHKTGRFWSVVSLFTFVTGFLIHPYLFDAVRIPLSAFIQTGITYIFISTLAYFYKLVRHRQEIHLQRQANIHYLTNTYNRHGLRQHLDFEISKAERYGTRLSFVLIDIDNFKSVNDTYGHKSGDILLQEMSHLTQDSIHKADIVARWGGEEFAILLPEADITQARQLAEKLRSIVASHEFETIGSLTSSLGVTQYNQTEVLIIYSTVRILLSIGPRKRAKTASN